MLKKLGHLALGVATALVVFAAVPAVLVVLVRLPVPPHWTRAAVLSRRGVFDLLAIVAWCAWATCCRSLLQSVTRRVRAQDLSTPGGRHMLEALSVRIATAILVVSPVLLANAALAQAAGPAPLAHRVSVFAVARDRAPDTLVVSTPPAPATETTVYTVTSGDSLWSIANRLYGDGDEWQSIARMNLGHLMDDGVRFLDPNLVQPGWVLQLPAPIPTPAPPPPMVPYSSPPSRTTGAEPTPTEPIVPTRPLDVAPGDTAPAALSRPVNLRSAPHHSRTSHEARTTSVARTRRSPAPLLSLPELVALGMLSLTAAALARRVRRLRWAAERQHDATPLGASDAAVDTETLLARFDHIPVLDWFEVANRHLTAGMSTRPSTSDVPAVRTIRVGPDGVEVGLDARTTWAPPEWSLGDDGRTWLLRSTLDLTQLGEQAKAQQPWIPVAVPVGENAQGTWLVPVEPGGCLPVIGPSASALVSAMALSLGSWSWAEQVVVTHDASRAEQEAALIGPDGDGAERLRVVYLGDPSSLSPVALRRCSVITTLPVPATDLTVAVDARAATIHPLGITLQPPAPSAQGLAAVSELLEVAAAPPPDEPLLSTPSSPLPLDALAPPLVEIRLLTPVPRIDGLVAPIDAKRARRATELVAYLALHRPDPVTSDRLRTRVLGSADADAAAKTLFNTAGAARRALGSAPDGAPYLPSATKTGLYRVSDALGIDVQRAARLVAVARQAEDPNEAMALLRAALELVEGEPFSAVLSGYNWWYAEGHGARVDTLLVGAACALADLASPHGLHELAAWGLGRARLVDPYSEDLTRAAMRAAAAADDTDWLRREWHECQRRAEELDPGSLPSESTELLYAALSRRAPPRIEVAAG